MTRQWYAAFTEARHEPRVVQELQAKGFDAYSPAETVWRRHARRKEPVRRALFPTYLFVLCDFDQDAPVVMHTDGVRGMIANAGRPLPISSDDVEELRMNETQGLFDRTVSRKITFRPGQPVQVVGGPFSGVLGKVMAAPAEARVRVMLEGLFGGKAEFSTDQIQHIDKSKAA